jgi:hypothetical protein
MFWSLVIADPLSNNNKKARYKALTYAKRVDELESGDPEVQGILEELNKNQSRR